MSQRHPARASLLALLLGLLALMGAADLAAAQAGTSCRGSAARGGDPASADYEPVVANANADPCVTDEAQSARTAPQNGLTAMNPKADTVRSAGLVGASASVDNVSGTGAGTVPIATGAVNAQQNGGGETDRLSGGSGNDSINSAFGADVVIGGSGRDAINVATAGPRARVSCGTGRDRVRLNNREKRRTRGCEVRYVLRDR